VCGRTYSVAAVGIKRSFRLAHHRGTEATEKTEDRGEQSRPTLFPSVFVFSVPLW